jgi:hypothetical protein
MYLLHAINSDRQTRLLNVLGQIAMYWEGGGYLCQFYHKFVCDINGVLVAIELLKCCITFKTLVYYYCLCIFVSQTSVIIKVHNNNNKTKTIQSCFCS